MLTLSPYMLEADAGEAAADVIAEAKHDRHHDQRQWRHLHGPTAYFAPNLCGLRAAGGMAKITASVDRMRERTLRPLLGCPLLGCGQDHLNSRHGRVSSWQLPTPFLSFQLWSALLKSRQNPTVQY
jgi:hypothetical protein